MKLILQIEREKMTYDETARFIGEVVETMVFRATQYLLKHPNLSLYHSDIRYQDNAGPWLDIPGTLQWGSGSCKELVPWRIAELRRTGEQAMVQVVVLNARPFHLQVLRADASIEDPSKRLGMK